MGINPQKLSQAQKMANDYGILKNGSLQGSADMAKDIIAKNGGKEVLDKALEKANNPFVKMALGKLGISNEMLNSAVAEIKGIGSNAPINSKVPMKEEQSNSLMDRLNKLGK